MRRHLSLLLIATVLLSSCASAPVDTPVTTSSGATVSSSSERTAAGFVPRAGAFGDMPYQAQTVIPDPAIAAEFNATEAANLKDVEEAYGLKLTAAERQMLLTHKFLLKNIPDTTIKPLSGEQTREFADLYKIVSGPTDYKNREPEHAVFYSVDAFMNSYTQLFTELLKEMENKMFFPQMRSLSEMFYTDAAQRASVATTDADKKKWTKVRNYFAVPYAIFKNAADPLTQDDYYDPNGGMRDPSVVMNEFTANDEKVDTKETAIAFVKTLKLDAASEADIIADLGQVFDAKGPGVPAVFKGEYDDYAAQTDVRFKVDFTQFTPRSHYTSSSLRRQYFRGMNWYIQLPFFLKSPSLTEYAFAVTELMAAHPEQLTHYGTLESAIRFLVGGSDDLMPIDYLTALEDAKGKPDQEGAVMEYLVKARNPRIKSLPAGYSDIGVKKTEDVLQLTKGMRFFSGKFLIDSYWTGMLTQGDEAPKPGYEQKLPPMASSLQVMALLGSDYAKSQIPTLDFYKPTTSKAIDKAMADLAAEEKTLDDAFWQESIYAGTLWTIKSLFAWQKTYKTSLPRFMQSPLWDAKTLMAASGFWTEMRHATLLYAKQSFAELGGGPGACDTRKVPEPPKGYIEPQPEAYGRLLHLAKRTQAGLTDRGFSNLVNLSQLENYITMMDRVLAYSKRQLENDLLTETVIEERTPDPDAPGGTCVSHSIQGDSDWEILRKIANDLRLSLPIPTEGPVLSVKDKRAALVADIHTGGDSADPHRILYQATGVPKLILVAVKDANGPRITVGFTYSHYEFTEPYGGKRLTDEQWQETFYIGEDLFEPYNYVSPSKWPSMNPWYQPLGVR